MPYPSVTRAQLRAQLQERWEGDPFWTDDDANQALNDALRLWSAYTGFWQMTTTALQPANDPFVVVTSPIHEQTRVVYNGYALEPTTLDNLDLGVPNWQNTRGTPAVWAQVDYATFVVYPSGSTNLTLTIEGGRDTPVLAADGDTVQLGEEEQVSILDYALHGAAFKRGAAFIEATQPHFERFMRAAQLRNAQVYMSLPFKDASKRGQHLTRVPNDVQGDTAS